MATAIKAVYEGGVFKPTEPVKLEEHTEVEVLLPASAEPLAADDPSGWQAIDSLVGCLNSGVADSAENHDKYLYGDPHA
jgi:hypothetical protein